MLGCETWDVVAEVEALQRQARSGIKEEALEALIDEVARQGVHHPAVKRRRLALARELAPEPGRFRSAILKAFARGKEWGLTEEQYLDLVSSPCTFCGGALGNGIGLDRTLNTKGYTPGNVVPCCGPCNIAKQRGITSASMQPVRH